MSGPSRKGANAILLGLLAVAGCTDERARPVTASGPELVPEPQVRIGSLDDPDRSLTSVGQVLIGDDGRLYVSQPQEATIRVFDAAGNPLQRIGRRGEGPGEFGRIDWIGWRGDTLYVSDSRLGRISFFAPGGDFLGSVQWVTPQFRDGPRLYVATTPQVVLDDGTALARPNWIERRAPPGGSSVVTGQRRSPIFRIDQAAEGVDTLLWHERRWTSVRLDHGGRESWIGCPFEASAFAELMPDGSGVVVVDAPVTSDPERGVVDVRLIGPTGDAVFERTLEYHPSAVDAAALRHAAGKIRRRLNGQRDTVPDVSDIERALREECLPPVLPPVTDLVAARDGSIWLRREETGAEMIAWDVLGPGGELRGSLRLPAGHRVVAAAGRTLVAVELDEFDVPYVVRYRLRD